MPDFVRVTNNDPQPFVYHSDNAKKRIPPGRDMMMPWALACALFGDPFKIDVPPKQMDRTDALKRARGNFNYELGMETDEHFMGRIPDLDIFDMETRQRMYMLLWDPEGEHTDSFISPDVDATDTVTLLQNQLTLLQGQMAQILAAQQQFTPELMGQTNVVSTDAPKQAGDDADLIKVTEWIDGNPFAQREDDAAAVPLFDFAAIATAPVDGPVPDGMPVDVDNAVTEDTPQDAGVGSGRGKPRLAPKSAP